MKRRSLRLFSDTPVSPEDRKTIMQAVLRAPTAGNMMLYTVIEVTDQAKKDKLVKTCDNQPMIGKAPMVLIFLADLQRWYDYYGYCDIHAVCERENLPYVTPKEGDFLLAASDALIAAQNAVVAAESLGMGSCYIGDVIENIETHRELFSLPKWTFPVTMVILGHPKKESNLPLAPRFPEEFIVHENGYRRFKGEEFDKMFAPHQETTFKNRNYLKSAENIGQHYYVRKQSSGFMEEMRRSFRKGMQEWLEEE